MSVDYEVAKDNEPKYVTIPRAQHEAYRAAAKALHDLIIGSNKKGCISRGHDALAALRAAGIGKDRTND